MALMPRGEPRSVPDPLSEAWDRAAALNRRLQAANFGEGGRRTPPFMPLERRLRGADMDGAQWQRLRAAQARGEEPPTVQVTASRKGGHPTEAAGTIDTNVPYCPVTLDQILVAGAKSGELGGERIRRRLPAELEQRWIGRGLFTECQGKIASGASAPVVSGYDAVIHTHPSNWSAAHPGDGDWGHKTPVYGIVGSRVWKIPAGADRYYWLK